MKRCVMLLAIAAVGCTKEATEAPPAEERVERVVVKYSDMTEEEERQHDADVAAAEEKRAALKADLDKIPWKKQHGAEIKLSDVGMEYARRMGPLADGRAKAAKWYREELESLTAEKLVERGKSSFQY